MTWRNFAGSSSQFRSRMGRLGARQQCERCCCETLEQRLPLTVANVSMPARQAAAIVSVPGVPSAVAAAPGNSLASLTWKAPLSNGGSGIVDYQIQFSCSSDGGQSWSGATVYDDGLSTRTTATVPSLVPVQYVFRVAARNAVGVGQASAWSNAVIPFYTPSRPSLTAVVAGNGQVQLGWTVPSSNGGKTILDYKIQYSTDAKQWATFNDGVSTATATVVTGLTNGTPYSFRVAAVNEVGEGTYSQPSAMAIPLPPAGVPVAPSAVVGTPGDGQINLSWAAPRFDGGSVITGYKVQYSSDGGTSWQTVMRPSGATRTTVGGLVNGTQYRFRVAAFNAIGTSAYSDVSSPVSPYSPQSKNEVWVNKSSEYAIAVWTAVDANGVGVGAPVVLNPGQTAYPASFTPGASKTLYIAYARNVNLVSRWYTLVDPNQRVTISSSQQIEFYVAGFNDIYVNGKKATAMY